MIRSSLVLTAVLLVLPGCKEDLYKQRRFDTFKATSLWADGSSARPLPEGTVARGDLAREAEAASPPHVTAALLERGRERFGIYCAPCHGVAGEGDGMIVQRGFPAPPSYHSQRLRSAPAQHFFDVITNGYGVMYPYAARVAPADRWAIVAYIRALQLSRRVDLASVPDAREHLP